MDCEKFDRVALDLLYDELDELTAASARRHMNHCARCGPIGNGLRATHEVGVIPTITPPAGLRVRILEAERSARAELTVQQRVGRVISVLAEYAMRPQLAMAAVLVLMVGMSLMLIPPQPGSRDSVRVTERGVPEVDTDELAETPLVAPAPATPRGLGQAHGPLRERPHRLSKSTQEKPADESSKPTGSAKPFDSAMADFRAGRYAKAQTGFEAVADAGGSEAARAELMVARSVRYANGCEASVVLLENVAEKYPQTAVASEATWFAGDCYRRLGRVARANEKYRALLDQPEYEDRARNALAGLSSATTADPPATAVAAHRKAAARKPKNPSAKSTARPESPAATSLPTQTTPRGPSADQMSERD